MPETIEKLLEESIEIDAPPATVWALVTDLPRMASWSPQVVRSKVLGGQVKEGATFVNLNRDRFLFWPTNGKVVRYRPPTDGSGEFGFRIKENKSIWSFQLEQTVTGGTRLTQRREAPDGLTGVSIGLTKVAFGGQQRFGGTLRQGMRKTLERIKAEAEE